MKFRQQNELNLVSMGDSQTAERSALGGATMAQTYPFLAAKARGYGAVSNVGISGNTTAQMLARFAADVLPHRSGAVSVMGFVNDLTTNISGGSWVGGGIDPATTKANLKSMVTQAQAQRCRVTLLTAVPVFETLYLDNAGPYLTAIREIPGETGCEFIDVYAAFIALDETTRSSLMLDDQHPNAAGHAYIAGLAAGDQFGQV
jgi:lysophospholipase L1-like esterase